MPEENERYFFLLSFARFLFVYVYRMFSLLSLSLFVLYYWILLNGKEEEEEETNARRSESEHIYI